MTVQSILQLFIPTDNIPSAMIILFNRYALHRHSLLNIRKKSSPRFSVWTNQEAVLWEVPTWDLHLSVKLSDSITDR